MKILNFQKKKIKPLTNEHQELYEKIKTSNICKKKFKQLIIQIIVKLKNIVIMQVNRQELHIPYEI